MQQIESQTALKALPGLIAQVEAGEEIVLLRAGKAVARIVPEANETDEPPELTPEQQAQARIAIVPPIHPALASGSHFEEPY